MADATRRNLKIGMFGYGVVGQGLYDVLNRTDGIGAEIIRICVKHRDKPRNLSGELFVYDARDLVNDDGIDVIVEVIDDADEAYRIAKAAMQQGKHVVSANKKMVAGHLTALVRLQRANDVCFLYEASTCAGIPIIRNLEEYYDNDMLEAFEGIVNGSSNYVLTRMTEDGKDYVDALAEAQDLGFAEADPSLDVGGMDSTYKLVILCAHAFGVVMSPGEVFTYGINTVDEYDIRFGAEKKLKIKLVASCRMTRDGIAAWVMPRFVDSTSGLFYVDNENNSVVIEGVFSDAQQLAGKGAGGYPTASAMISDISALTYGYRYEYKKQRRNSRVRVRKNASLKIYARSRQPRALDQIPFDRTLVTHQGDGYTYAIGTVQLGALAATPATWNEDVFLAQIE